MAEHRSFTRVAATQGKSREALRDYLRRRPELNERMRGHLPDLETPEDRLAYGTQLRLASGPVTVLAKRRSRRRHKPTLRQSVPARLRRTGVQLTDLGREFMDVVLTDPCAYCGEPCEHIDHIDPVHGGGHSDWDNVTAACSRCNGQKADRPLLHFMLMRVRKGALAHV